MSESTAAPPGHSQAIWEIGQLAARARRADLLAAFLAQFGPAVQAGPFAGMLLSSRVSSTDGDLLPRLLGCYEAELHEAIEAIVAAEPDLVVNVGAAEGFYPIGFARRLPGAHVHGFDTNDLAQDICREAARLNGMEARVSVGGQCSPMVLQHLLARAQRPVLICDCEGDERLLVDPVRVPALAGCLLVVECYDFIDATITQALAERLAPTHELSAIREGARDPNAMPFLQGLNSLDRWLAVCEFRPCTMHWLIGTPKRGV